MTSGVHTSLRSGNPALSGAVFEQRVGARAGGEVMTISGVVNKTAILLLLVVITATYAWTQSTEAPQPGLLLVGGLGGLGVALVTVFKKTWAPYTAPLYALLEGLLLGGISAIFERRYPGIVSRRSSSRSESWAGCSSHIDRASFARRRTSSSASSPQPAGSSSSM